MAVLVVLGVTLLTFGLLDLLNTRSGGVARAILGPRATPGAVDAFNHANDFDRPVWVQFWHYLTHLLRGDLGYSYKQNRSVGSLLVSELPRDLLLGGLSLLFSLAIAIPVGLVQAARRGRAVDHGLSAVSFALYAMPPYAVAILLVQALSISLHVFPVTVPAADASFGAILNDPGALVLPVASLTLVSYAYFSRYMRSAAIETLAQAFITTARAKGLDERQVLVRHVLRNSLLTVVTLVGLSLPVVITGTVVTEAVFNYPGVGLEYLTAAQTDDYQVMLGVTVLIGVITVLGNLAADIAYALLDPRVGR